MGSVEKSSVEVEVAREKDCTTQLLHGIGTGAAVGLAASIGILTWTSPFHKPGVSAARIFSNYAANLIPGCVAIGAMFPLIDCTLRDSGSSNKLYRSAVAGCATGSVVLGLYHKRIQSAAVGCAVFGAVNLFVDAAELFAPRPHDDKDMHHTGDAFPKDPNSWQAHTASMRAAHQAAERTS